MLLLLCQVSRVIDFRLSTLGLLQMFSDLVIPKKQQRMPQPPNLPLAALPNQLPPTGPSPTLLAPILAGDGSEPMEVTSPSTQIIQNSQSGLQVCFRNFSPLFFFFCFFSFAYFTHFATLMLLPLANWC